MTELKLSNAPQETSSTFSSEFLAGATLVGVFAFALSKSFVSWLEDLERKHHRGQLLAAYRSRHSWKRSDVLRLEALGVNDHAKMRMRRLAGRGRPVVKERQPFDKLIVERFNSFALLVGSGTTPADRRRSFKTWPWWKHHVEAYYRGEHELAKCQGLKSPSLEAEIKVGRALGMSPSAVHSVCVEIRHMRQEDELSANFPAETLEDYERWMNLGAAATWPDEPMKLEQTRPVCIDAG